MERRERIRGLILGTAVGDALGLPAEGIPRLRAHKIFGQEWRHRFLGRWGMVSDDTEHTLFVAQSLMAHPDSSERFAKRLAWCLRGWLLTLPAGIGMATLRSILRLWCGIPPHRSGVYSAGNGPAMRSAPIGACFPQDPSRLESFLQASTLLTHTDPRALIGARAIARLSAWIIAQNAEAPPAEAELNTLLVACGEENAEWQAKIEALLEALRQDLTVEEFAAGLGLENGVTGYIFHTVPVAVYAWRRHFGDYRATLAAILDCGGDTDTTGAIAGALAGATVGAMGIPADWLSGVREWPRSLRILCAIADRLTEASETQAPHPPVSYFWPGLFLRNALFLIVVLLHGFRRLAPPY